MDSFRSCSTLPAAFSAYSPRAGFPTLLLMLTMLLTAPVAVQAQQSLEHDGRQWADHTNGEDVPWEEARDWCQALELEGHNDWRLPHMEELTALHDPDRPGSIKIASPLPQATCCLWSGTSTADQQPEDGHFYVDRLNDAEEYHWGFLYSDEGTPYYSVNFFPDGQALCTRDP